ncbi:MAG: NACHT domain-containing protein [Janthinobacterium lividum]
MSTLLLRRKRNLMSKIYPWERRWLQLPTDRAASDKFHYEIESSGYIPAVELGPGLVTLPIGIALDTIGNEHLCTILLGEPGIGKSSEWKKLREKLSEESRHLFLDLGSFTSEEILKQEIVDDPNVVEWKQDDSILTIWLDSLDEGLLHISRLQEGLQRILKKLPIDRLRLRITCRNAVWPAAFTTSLRGLWKLPPETPSEQFSILLLRPLTREQVALAAEQEEFDSEAFLEAVAQVDAEPLASTPVTLQLLLNLYRKHQPSFGISETAGRAGLYERGCLELCEGPDQQRDEQHRQDGNHRLLLAGYLAYLAVFSNRRQIHIEPVKGSLGENELDPHAAGSGLTATWQNIQATISAAGIRDLLKNTALFSDLGNGRIVWIHQAFAEFLAAWYANLAGIPIANLNALFRSATDPTGGVVPALRETAAWLAELQPAFWQELLQLDALSLILGDMRRLTDEQRATVVEHLFRKMDTLAFAPYMQSRERSFMLHLQHPGLAQQLEAVLTNPDSKGARLRFAIDMGKNCEVRELAPVLAKQALDENLSFSMRAYAMDILAVIAGDSEKMMLKPLTHRIPREDIRDEFRGDLLHILWSEYLTPDELLPLITPERDDHFAGSYRLFLHRIEKDELSFSLESVLASIRWLTQNIPLLDFNHAREAFWREINQLIWRRAWKLVAEPGLLEAMAELFVITDKYHQPFNVDEATLDNRINLLEHLLHLKERPYPHSVVVNIHNYPPLVKQEDWEVIYTLLNNNLKASEREWLTRVLMELLMLTPINVSAIVYCQRYDNLHSIAHRFKSSRQAFYPWCAADDLENSDVKKRRKYAEKSRLRKQKELRKKLNRRRNRLRKFAKRMRYLLQISAKGSIITFGEWHVLLYYISSEKTPSGFLQHYDISQSKRWAQLYSTQQDKIIELACDIVARYPVPPQDWYSMGHGVSNYAFSLYRALLLCNSQRPDYIEALPQEFWENWSNFLVKLEGFSSENKQYPLLKVAALKAPNAVDSALFLKVDADDDNRDGREVYDFKDWYRLLPAMRFPALMLQAVEDGVWRENLSATLLIDMLAVGYDPVNEYVAKLIPESPKAVPERPKLAMAVYQWLIFRNEDHLPDVWQYWERLMSQRDIAAGAISSAINHPVPSGFQYLTILNEEQLKRLILWLTHAFELTATGIDDWQEANPKGKYGTLRMAVASELASRGTLSAWAILQELATDMDEPYWLRVRLDQVRENLRRNSWQPTSSRELIELSQDAGVRWVKSAADLQELVLESLARFQVDLHNELVAANQLWMPQKSGSRITGHKVRDENFLSDTIRRHLVQDLQRTDILIKREVEIRPSTGKGSGQRTDIYIDAFSRGLRDEKIDVVTLVIEVKLSKNKEVETALKNQLVPYLVDQSYKYGIYLIGWHYGQYNKRPVSTKDLPSLHKLLEQQTHAVDSEFFIRTVILDIRLAADAARASDDARMFKPI